MAAFVQVELAVGALGDDLLDERQRGAEVVGGGEYQQRGADLRQLGQGLIRHHSVEELSNCEQVGLLLVFDVAHRHFGDGRGRLVGDNLEHEILIVAQLVEQPLPPLAVCHPAYQATHQRVEGGTIEDW